MPLRRITHHPLPAIARQGCLIPNQNYVIPMNEQSSDVGRTAIALPSRASKLKTGNFSLFARPFSLFTRPFSLFARPFSLFARPFSLFTRPFSLFTRPFSLFTRPSDLRTQNAAFRTPKTKPRTRTVEQIPPIFKRWVSMSA